MNYSILRKLLIVLTFVLGLTVTAQSQTYVLSTVAGEGRDSVTVGSLSGYQIARDPAIVALSAIMNPSIFQWAFIPVTPVMKPDGITPATLVSPGFYSDTAISAIMPAAVGSISLSVLERSQPKAGTGCDGAVQTLNIDVLSRAKITFTGTSNGACSAANYNIPVNLTGFGPWTIEYSITYTTFAGVSSPAVNYLIGSGAAILGVLYQTSTSLNLPITAAQLSSGLGTYAVNIKNVYDRFGMKSLDLTKVASQVTDLPATAYSLIIYPTPVTSPIMHVKNL